MATKEELEVDLAGRIKAAGGDKEKGLQSFMDYWGLTREQSKTYLN